MTTRCHPERGGSSLSFNEAAGQEAREKASRLLSTASPSHEVIPTPVLREPQSGGILADGVKHFVLNEGSVQKTARGDSHKVTIAVIPGEMPAVP